MNTPKYKVGDVLWDWRIDDDTGPELVSYTILGGRTMQDGSLAYVASDSFLGEYCDTVLSEDARLFASAEEALLDLLQEAKDLGISNCTMDEIYILCLKTILNKLKPKEP